MPVEAWRALAARTQPLTQAAGLSATIAGALLLYEPTAWPVDVPLVGDDHATVLRDLLAADVDAVADAADEATGVAAGGAGPSGLVARARRRCHEADRRHHRGPGPRRGALRVRRIDAHLVRRSATGRSAATRCGARLASSGDPAAADIEAFRAAALTVAAASADVLAPHVAGTLDAASHRVDAWATSLATRRLAELRAEQPTGVLVGGYGWVEALAPRPATRVTEPVAGRAGAAASGGRRPGVPARPVDPPGRGGGAAAQRPPHPRRRRRRPVRDHASRPSGCGWPSGSSTGCAPAAASASCSATWSSATCTSAGSTQSIDNAREVSPLPGEEHAADPGRAGSTGCACTSSGPTARTTPSTTSSRGSQDADRCGARPPACCVGSGSAVDAAADLLQAEQVHQFGPRRPHGRAVNTLGDIDRGLAPPPDLDVVQTPRTGVGVTHRVAVVLDPSTRRRPAGWAGRGQLAAGRGRAGARRLAGADASARRPVRPDRRSRPASTGAHGRRCRTSTCPPATSSGWPAPVSRDWPSWRSRAARGVPGPPTSAAARALRADGRRCSTCSSSAGRWPCCSVAAHARSTARSSSRRTPTRNPGSTSPSWTHGRRRARRAVRAAVDALDAALAGAGPGAVRDAVADGWALGLGDAAVPGDGDRARAGRPPPRGPATALQARLDEAGATASSAPTTGRPPSGGMRALLGPGFVALPRFVPPDAADLVGVARRPRPGRATTRWSSEIWLTRLERVREPLRRSGHRAARGGGARRAAAARWAWRRCRTVPATSWNALPARPPTSTVPVSLVLSGADAGRAGPARSPGSWSTSGPRSIPSATETHGRRVPLRPAGPHGAAGDPARGAARDRRAVDGRHAEPGAGRDPRAGAPARGPAVGARRGPAVPARHRARLQRRRATPSSTNPNALHAAGGADMASITTFSRLEPEPRGPTSRVGAAAPVQDPMWLLARQWQVGEFAGHDGGTPIAGPLARRRRGADALRRRSDPARHRRCRRRGSTPLAAPLETLIERVARAAAGRRRDRPEGLRLAVDTGRLFLRVLALQSTSRDYARRRGRRAFVAADADAGAAARRSTPRPPATRGCTPAAASTAGGCAASSPAATCPGSTSTIDQADRAELRPAAADWLRLVARLFATPSPTRRAGSPTRFEHTASIAGRMSADPFGETTLTAHRYDSDTLDWYELDVNGEVNLGTTPAEAGQAVTRTVMPAPVTAPGLPARRFWEFEDGRLNLAALRPAETDLGQVLLIETLSGFGNDWFVIGVELPVGHLVSATSLVVTDTFGVPDAAAAARRPPARRDRRWGLFQHAMPFDRRRARGRADHQPALPRARGSRSRWWGRSWSRSCWPATSRPTSAGRSSSCVESPLQVGVELSAARPAEPPGDPDVAPDYHLAQAPPPHWIPLLPVRVDGPSRSSLARGSVLDLAGGRPLVSSVTALLGGGPDGRC